MDGLVSHQMVAVKNSKTRFAVGASGAKRPGMAIPAAAGEQTWAIGRGVGGAKEEDRGEHRRATHVPDSEPGKRVPGARLGTRSCSWGFDVNHPRWEPGA